MNDDRSFKYDSVIHSSEIDRPDTNYSGNGITHEYYCASNTSTEEQEERGRAFFREHYRKHSEQLVDALKKWADGLNFTSYEYRENSPLKRILIKNIPERVDPGYIPYIKEMNRHLDKAYPNWLPKLSEIESERKVICTQIENVTISLTSTVPYKPSYERIIVDRIKECCPALRRLHDVTLTENNIYLDYIFGIIFDTITRQGVLTLDIKPEYESDIKQLLYENATIIAQGEDGLMINLKRVLHELLTDKSIKNRIEEYQEQIAK